MSVTLQALSPISAPMPAPSSCAFDPHELRWLNRYTALGEPHVFAQHGAALPDPHWAALSRRAAELLGWPADWWQADGALDAFSAGTPWPGMQPASTVYSGHQFGVWAGQLGDGRALLLGEVASPAGPQELQLKGSGKTPYSRMGDGRAVLRSSIREFLCSEAMHALGIPTTRALALTASDLPVRREGIETAAVVTRLAPSFLRFGHFEHFCHHNQPAALRRLLDFVLAHHYPECRDAPEPAAALLQEVSRRTAELLADWQAVGFCHGVMNTDNMSILGLTIDYGPFGFLDAFDPGHICNHSDNQGRYAYARQPGVAYWNLHALAQALTPLVQDTDSLLAALEPYRSEFPAALTRRMRAKLGLTGVQGSDPDLIDDFLRLLEAGRVDYTIAFRRLGNFCTTPAQPLAAGVGAAAENAPIRDLFLDRLGFDAWAERYAAQLRLEGSLDAERAVRMAGVNPKYILRNHLAQEAIRQAEGGDYAEVTRLAQVLERPFDEQPEHSAYADFPPDWACSLEISCSS
ncbi:MAG: YdiU family protein [Leptothrix sp. (in: b-proteobacteria)]